jgi:predicted dehydrogenase
MKIGVVVVGVGNQGARRSDIYKRTEGCDLVGICDKDPTRKVLTDRLNCEFSTNLDYFLKRSDVDLIQISTNASQHYEIAEKAQEYGKHVAVEKPFTTKFVDGKEIAYNHKGLVIVEASERCNPVIWKLKSIIPDLSPIVSMYHRRYGIFYPNIDDVGALYDLGYHEFDIGSHITEEEPEIVFAELSNRSKLGYEHDARILARFGSINSTIHVSWLPEFKIRTLELTTKKENLILDYAGQRIRKQTQPERDVGMDEQSGGYQYIQWLAKLPESDISVANWEPFQREQSLIVKSVKEGEILPPLCSGEEALVTLKALERALSFKR